MATERDAELYKKIRAYNMQFINYILRKANNDSKVNLAIETLIAVNVYQAMALVVSPKCPEEYQAQIDALKATLDKVFDYLHSDRYNKETESQLENEVVDVRQRGFTKFLGKCAGLEVRDVEKPELANVLDKVFRNPRGKYYWMDVIMKAPLPQVPESPPSPKAIELAQAQAKALGEYLSHLVDYILQKTNKDLLVPVALMGLEISYLNNNLFSLFMFTEPNLCQEFFTGEELQTTVDILKDMVKAINGAYDAGESIPDTIRKRAVDFVFWRTGFLARMAFCYGIDMDVVPVPKGNDVEIVVLRYEPLKPDTEQGSQGSQEAPEG